MNELGLTVLCAASALLLHSASCGPSSPTPDELDALGTARLTIKAQPFLLWVADDSAEQTQGLMFVTAERMTTLSDGTERGMIFIFDHEREMSFWMKNTIIPLDIAYVDSQGKIVKTYTMAALDDRIGQYTSDAPARYAIEVNAGVWDRLGVTAGDRIEIPSTLLKHAP